MNKFAILTILFAFSVFSTQAQSGAEIRGKLQELKTKCEGVAQSIKGAWAKDPKAQSFLVEAESRYLNIRAKHDNYITTLQEGVKSAKFKKTAKKAQKLADQIEVMTTDLDNYFKEKNQVLKNESYGGINLIVIVCKVIDCTKIPQYLKQLWDKAKERREENAKQLDTYRLREWKNI